MSELREPADNPATWKMGSPGSSPADVRSQKRDLLAEQQKDWAADQPCPVDHYLERWPADPNTDPDAASLLVSEIFQRRDRGERPSLDEYERTIPRARFRAGRPDQARESHSLARRQETGPRSLAAAPRGGRGDLRFSSPPATGTWGLCQGVPRGAAGPGQPAGGPEDLRHRGKRARDPGPVAAHQHRAYLLRS